MYNMSDRTFRLILDGKKGGLVKGTTPASAAKKACNKLSVETGKTSFKFELQETTKDSKKKVYGPYKGCLIKDKIKVNMVGGSGSGSGSDSGSGSNSNNNNNNINMKRIINKDANELLYLLLSNNKNNKIYFNEEKYESLIFYLSKLYNLQDQLKKLESLKHKLDLINNINSNINYKKIFIEMRKMLSKNISEIRKKLIFARGGPLAFARGSPLAFARGGPLAFARGSPLAFARGGPSAFAREDPAAAVERPIAAADKNYLLRRYLNNNAKLH
jgi:hypothetical protein